jgi:hypothetical protein
MPKISVKPATEILLSQLEAEYLEKRDVNTYQRIFSEILPYARSLILKRTKGKIYLPPDLVEEAALESTIKYLSQYSNPLFTTRFSFGGLLSLKILESLYGPKIKANDQILSLNAHIESGKGKDTELGDLPENYNFTYLFRPNSDSTQDPVDYLFNKDTDAIDNIITVIKDVFRAVDLHSFYIISLAITQFIDKSKTLDKFKSIFFTPEITEVYDLSLLEIRNRLQGVA